MFRVDVELLLERLQIRAKRVGARKFEASCPNPDHITRSGTPWFIRDEPGHPYHACHSCLSCGFHGGPMKLVAIVLDITPKEAIDWLKEMPPTARPVPHAVELELRERFAGLVMPDVVEFATLDAWPDDARSYVLDVRKLTASQVVRWGLGFAPEGLAYEDGELEGIPRVVIPVRDGNGRLLSYTARAIVRAKRKYREPAARERPSPAAVFGEEWWPSERSTVVVTEGAFNALAVERALPDVAIAALMGSSLHPSQVSKLASFARVVVATDQDDAGRKAFTMLHDVLARHAVVARVLLPEGVDCDALEPAELARLVSVG